MSEKSMLLKINFEKSCPSEKFFPPDEGVELAICGRSNSGKSSILNMLANQKKLAKTSNTPGRTQSINFFIVNEDTLKKLVDLPGYGYAKASKKMQKEWGQQITKYMASRKSLRGIILIMDVRRPLQESDLNFIAWCEQYNLPMQILLNKSDKLSKNKASQELMKCVEKTAHNLLLDSPMLLSAKTASGAEELSKKILDWMEII
ncbi:MAG: ribosome biogenesis GTP-binding protein YihA/YsxC [Pseudomonadota bacterium]|nr:ribosome biogenesis GTP-binding protein YihA/YsxC [Pseudomonadota bacterium]MEC8378070.1 ribosome biogenesis GTP-binding protein YihA/YsxC [Pseudomonadota bacterium]